LIEMTIELSVELLIFVLSCHSDKIYILNFNLEF
jgi:hypothetical protein